MYVFENFGVDVTKEELNVKETKVIITYTIFVSMKLY